MITHAHIMLRHQAAGGKNPLLTLAEFFEGNEQEDSLAPNQWGSPEEGGCNRLPLADIHQRLLALQASPDVAWVRVQLHEETFDGEEVTAESIAMCTSASADDIEQRLQAIDTLSSDGVMEGLSYDEDDFCDMPSVPTGYHLLSLVWD